MDTSQETPSGILEDDDEDLVPALMDRKCHLRTSMVPKKAYTSVREPSIGKRFSEIREANFLEDGGKEEACPLELEEHSLLSQSAHEQSMSGDKQSHNDKTALSTPEQNEFSIPSL